MSLGALLLVGLQSCRLSGSLTSTLGSLGFSAHVKKPETKQREQEVHLLHPPVLGMRAPGGLTPVGGTAYSLGSVCTLTKASVSQVPNL